MDDWRLEYQVRWFVWIPINLYGEIVHVFMAILGLGGLGVGISSLLGYSTWEVDPAKPAWQSYGMFILSLVFAVFIGYTGLRSAWETLLALFTPALVYEGTLDEVSEQRVQTSRNGYTLWILKAGSLQWEIGKASAPSLGAAVRGRRVRIRYRRGTHEVTRISTHPVSSHSHSHEEAV